MNAEGCPTHEVRKEMEGVIGRLAEEAFWGGNDGRNNVDRPTDRWLTAEESEAVGLTAQCMQS